MKTAQRFRFTDIPRQKGEKARLKVISGPDAGAVYVLTSNEARIGRGEENDVVIADLKASRSHAEVIAVSTGGWLVNDLKSANGISFNGKPARTATLNSGDTFGVGETLFEFVTSESPTSILRAPPKTTQDVKAIENARAEQVHRVQAITTFGGPAQYQAQVASGVAGKKQKPSFAVLGILLAVGAFLVFDVGSKKMGNFAKKAESPAAPSAEARRDLASFLPEAVVVSPAGIAETEKSADVFFQSGFREFREGNYLRAKAQFETVLQINPNHRLAKLYNENSNQAIQDEIKGHLQQGKKTFEAGKYNEAKSHYEAIRRLLYRDQTNPAFTESMEQLEKIKRELKEAT